MVLSVFNRFLTHKTFAHLCRFGKKKIAVAATVISPLELFRTRMQSVHTDTKGNAGLFRGVSQGIVAMVRSEGVLSLWRGLAPTLWRDVPFSGKFLSFAALFFFFFFLLFHYLRV